MNPAHHRCAIGGPRRGSGARGVVHVVRRGGGRTAADDPQGRPAARRRSARGADPELAGGDQEMKREPLRDAQSRLKPATSMTGRSRPTECPSDVGSQASPHGMETHLPRLRAAWRRPCAPPTPRAHPRAGLVDNDDRARSPPGPAGTSFVRAAGPRVIGLSPGRCDVRGCRVGSVRVVGVDLGRGTHRGGGNPSARVGGGVIGLTVCRGAFLLFTPVDAENGVVREVVVNL